MFFARKTPTPAELEAELAAERAKVPPEREGLYATLEDNARRIEAAIERLKQRVLPEAHPMPQVKK